MIKKSLFVLIGLLFLTGCTVSSNLNGEKNVNKISLDKINENDSIATFSGGCFWCSEAAFQDIEGVSEVISGYVSAPGNQALKAPSYEEVASGSVPFREGVQVYYDSKVISYDELVDIFWSHINPTQKTGQFADKGFQYTTVIYYDNQKEKLIAEQSKKNLDSSKLYEEKIVTEILPFTNFYKAEEKHQDYYLKNSAYYGLYAKGSGRKDFIKETEQKKITLESKKATQEELSKLTNLQYHITQEDGTEIPFDNEYWDNKEEGIYVDVVTGEALFSSKDKFDSGSGWPSFTKPLSRENVKEEEDNSLGMKRTEVSSVSGSHLGHVFDDGPKDKGGERYCINSASLKFIPASDLEKEGYLEYQYLFK